MPGDRHCDFLRNASADKIANAATTEVVEPRSGKPEIVTGSVPKGSESDVGISVLEI